MEAGIGNDTKNLFPVALCTSITGFHRHHVTVFQTSLLSLQVRSRAAFYYTNSIVSKKRPIFIRGIELVGMRMQLLVHKGLDDECYY